MRSELAKSAKEEGATGQFYRMSNAGSVVGIRWLKAQNFITFLHYEAQPPGSDAAEKMMCVWW